MVLINFNLGFKSKWLTLLRTIFRLLRILIIICQKLLCLVCLRKNGEQTERNFGFRKEDAQTHGRNEIRSHGNQVRINWVIQSVIDTLY
jgi:hypothetical protein